MTVEQFINVLKARRAELNQTRRVRIKTLVNLDEPMIDEALDYGRRRVMLINRLIRLEEENK